MAEPAFQHYSEDQTDFLVVIPFWLRPSSELPFPQEPWIRQLFLAVSFSENCHPNGLLKDSVLVFDDSPQKRAPISETDTIDGAKN